MEEQTKKGRYQKTCFYHRKKLLLRVLSDGRINEYFNQFNCTSNHSYLKKLWDTTTLYYMSSLMPPNYSVKFLKCLKIRFYFVESSTYFVISTREECPERKRSSKINESERNFFTLSSHVTFICKSRINSIPVQKNKVISVLVTVYLDGRFIRSLKLNLYETAEDQFLKIER